MPTPPDVATLVSALTPDSDADQVLLGGGSTASKTPQATVSTPPEVVTLAPASDVANTQTAFLTMPVTATSATEGEAGLLSDGFERLGVVSGKIPQFRVHTAPISDAANVAAGDSISLNFSPGEFGSGLIDLSNMSIHTNNNNYNSSNSNNNHINTTTISGNKNTVTNGDQSTALEVTKLSFGTGSSLIA